MSNPLSCGDAIEAAYAAFEPYRRPAEAGFCEFCYSEAEIAYLRSTDLRSIDVEHARKITWENSDHWDSVEQYKHYLPRILAGLTPPDRCDDIYPAHLFEVLDYHHFARWPEAERQAVVRWASAVADALAREDAEDAEAWRAAARFQQSG